MTNPFIFRGPVRNAQMFFGRSHELAEVAAFLRGNQSVSIVGPRKFGKTSLLYHLMRQEAWDRLGMDQSNLFAYLDCEVLGDSNHEEIFGALTSEIAAALDEREIEIDPTLENAINQPSRLSFERAVRKLNQGGLRVVLILDEFERLSANPHLDVNFFNALRSAAGRYQLAYLTASARPLIQLTYTNKQQEILSSPFFNIFAPLFLGMLSEAEAMEAITQPAMAGSRPFPDNVTQFIYNLVGGFPLGLQVACFHAWEVGANGVYDLDEIERRTLQELNPHFQYYWRNLEAHEQQTLLNLSDATHRQESDTTLRAILRDLVQKSLVVVSEGAYSYPFRAWANFVSSQQSPPQNTTGHHDGSLSGLQIGSYVVLEPLGRGGMSEVYKGHHSRLDRTVAIKILPARLAVETDFRMRFEREARAIATLRHPNIVQVFDFGDLDGMYYMVMEYVNGKDLAHFLREQGRLSIETAFPILRDMANALDYAHSQGLVHRDVKPSNILLERTPPNTSSTDIPRPVLTDFGIAKLLKGEHSDTKTGMMIGTLDYMAPEQIRSSGEVDHHADIYSLSALAYQMLTGKLPFQGDNPGMVMLSHLQAPAPDPRQIIPDLPVASAEAILTALSKDPRDRFSSAGEFIRHLAVNSAANSTEA